MFTFPRFCILPLKPRMPFYAVAKGRSPGIYKTWDDCKAQIEKFSGAAFKKFNTEAECNRFISERAAGSSTNTEGVQKPTIISNAVAQKALHTTPSGNKFTGGSRQGQRHTKFTAPQRQQPTRDSHSSATDDDVDVKFLANLGNCLKRRSTADQDTRKTKQGRYEFQTDKLGFVHVYTDGSCVNNGKVGARAGLGVYFGEDHPLNRAEPVRGRPTNNSGEIQASIVAIKLAKEQGLPKLCINTDSHFLINSITMWVPGWKRKGWKLANGERVKNQEDFQELDRLYNGGSMEIKWNYVKAHNGTLGNERADQLAKDGAAQYIFSEHFNRQ